MYLLDANIISYYLDRKRYHHLNELIDNIEENEIKISSIVLAELEYGAFNGKPEFEKIKRKNVYNFVKNYQLLCFDEFDARAFGQIRSELESQGQVIGAYDMLIAGQALARDLTLVTHNRKEFKRVPFLSIEDWI